jgi:imidazolonepropionase-like amidohydrolase
LRFSNPARTREHANQSRIFRMRAGWLRAPFAFSSCLMLAGGWAQAQVTVLRHVTIIDGNGGAPRHNAALVIEGEKIVAITDANAPLPKGAKVVDLPGKTIMPELVSAHAHLGLMHGTGTAWSNYTRANVEKQLRQYQDYGVGAVLSMGTDQPEIWKWREESHAGKFPGALIYTAGSGFGVPGGLPPAMNGHDPTFRPTTPEEARRDIRMLAPHKPDVVKIWVDDFWGQYPKMKPEIYAAIIDEAHKEHLRVAAHVYHLADAQRLAEDGVDMFAHSIRDAVIPDSLVEEMKSKHIAQITTMSLDDFLKAYAGSPAWLDDPYFRDALEPGMFQLVTSPQYMKSVQESKVTVAERRSLPFAMENMMKLYKAGVTVVMGTDSGANPQRVVGFGEHHELALMVRAGLTPLEAITLATKNGAQLLRASNEFGVLRPGLRANFIVLDKDPSVDIRNTETIYAVWKNGELVSHGPHPRED